LASSSAGGKARQRPGVRRPSGAFREDARRTGAESVRCKSRATKAAERRRTPKSFASFEWPAPAVGSFAADHGALRRWVGCGLPGLKNSR
jgi:hypothetical protein